MDDCLVIKGCPSKFKDAVERDSVVRMEEYANKSVSGETEKHLIICGGKGTGKRTLVNMFVNRVSACLDMKFKNIEYKNGNGTSAKTVLMPMFYTSNIVEFSVKDIEQRLKHFLKIIFTEISESDYYDDPTYVVMHEANRIKNFPLIEYFMRIHHYCRFIFVSDNLSTFTPEILSQCSVINTRKYTLIEKKKIANSVLNKCGHSDFPLDDLFSNGNIHTSKLSLKQILFHIEDVILGITKLGDVKKIKTLHDYTETLKRTLKNADSSNRNINWKTVDKTMMNMLAKDVNVHSVMFELLMTRYSNKTPIPNDLIDYLTTCSERANTGSRPIIHLQSFYSLLCQQRLIL